MVGLEFTQFNGTRNSLEWRPGSQITYIAKLIKVRNCRGLNRFRCWVGETATTWMRRGASLVPLCNMAADHRWIVGHQQRLKNGHSTPSHRHHQWRHSRP